MDYKTEELILHGVTEADLAEVARTWPSERRPISEEAARGVIARMRENYGRNTIGRVTHLCLAVCRAEDPRTILGWCGLDGRRDPGEPEIFLLQSVHGGCDKDNIASRRAMEKGGMVRYGAEENGDPLYRYCAKKRSRTGGQESGER